MTTLRATSASSGPAIWYRVRADLRGRRVQAGSVILVIALSTLLASLGLVALDSIRAPFDRLFTQLNGAHLWVHISPHPSQTELDTIRTTPNVAGMTDVEEDIYGAMVVGGNREQAYFQSFPTQSRAIGRLLITRGQGLSADDPDGVVVDQPFAERAHLQVGDMLSIVTAQGPASVHIRGLSVDVNHAVGDLNVHGFAYVLRSTLEQFFPAPGQLGGLIGLKLKDPYAIQPTINTLVKRLQALGVPYSFFTGENWLSFRATFGQYSTLAATLLLAFGVLGLLAAGVIIANLVIGQVLAQQRDLAILKALGFTPGQVVLALVLEYLLLGLLGAVIGLALAALVAPMLLTRVGSAQGVSVPPHYDLGTSVLMLLGILLVMALSAALPAWRAGRLRVAEAIRPGSAAFGRRRARLAGLLLSSGLPLVVALGLRSATARPLRTLLVTLTLLVGVLTSVVGLGLVATIQTYVSNPGLQGIFSDLSISPGLYDEQATRQLATTRPEIAFYYSVYSASGQLPDGIHTLNTYLTTGDTRRIQQALSSGRWYHEGADELVLTTATFHQLGAHLGDQLPLVFTTPSGQKVKIAYTIVGVLPMPFTQNLAFAPLASYTTQVSVPEHDLLMGTAYFVTLRPGKSAQAFAQALSALADERMNVSVNDATPPASISQLKTVMAALSAVLMLIAGVSVLNAMLLSTRERFREFGVFKAIGLTPSQVLACVTTSAGMPALLAAIVGIPLGLWLTDAGLHTIAQSMGLADVRIGVNWPALALLIPATLLVAVLGAYLPARRMARISASEALHYE
jgi:putative ABC transport system permease protein